MSRLSTAFYEALLGWEGWDEGSDEAMAQRRRALAWRLLLQVDACQDDELLFSATDEGSR